MSDYIAFEVQGTPVPKQSFRYTKHGGGFQDPRMKAWTALVAARAREAMAGAEPIAEPVAVVIAFMLPDNRRRDIDNLAKGVLDGLNGTALVDDTQVHMLTLTKQKCPENMGCLVEIAIIDRELLVVHRSEMIARMYPKNKRSYNRSL